MAKVVLDRVVSDSDNSNYSVTINKTSNIAKIAEVASCLVYILAKQKRESFVGFYESKRTNAIVLLDLLKRAT